MIGIPGEKNSAETPDIAGEAGHRAGRSGAEDPLSFFTDGEEETSGAGGRNRMLLVASGAGVLAGFAIVGVLFGMTGRGDGTPYPGGRPADLLWQRPVISAKSDLSNEISREIGPAPRGAATGAPALPAADDPLEPRTRLLTAFALPGDARADDAALFSGRGPAILQASLILPGARETNETVIAKTPPAEPVDTSFVLRKGENIIDRLVEQGVARGTAKLLVAALEPVYPTRLLRAGQKISLTLDRQQDFYGSEVIFPVYLSFRPGKGEEVIVEGDSENGFSARSVGRTRAAKKRAKEKSANPAFVRARGRISSSLYAAARDQKIPGYIISQMLRAFSYDVDLQRQVAKGDTFDILYGPPLSGSSKRRKVLYYAALNLHGRRIAYYRFTTPGGRTAYFDEKGRSAVKGLMRTPISGARITSGFGMRRHPILGYSKMHTGVDFAAPRGTPIRAAGDGVVTYAAWRGGYGRTIMIRHASGYVTLYAHQSRFAPGLRKGMRVRQGQVIGYVGSTGRSTGPHLHFEVRLNNRPLNPLRVRTAHYIRLKGKALAAFKKRRKRILALLREAPSPARVARK